MCTWPGSETKLFQLYTEASVGQREELRTIGTKKQDVGVLGFHGQSLVRRSTYVAIPSGL